MEDNEWPRLPAEGDKCFVTGLYRSSLAEILEERNPSTGEKYVLSVERRKEGATRGIRLINKKSLLKYLERSAQAQNGLRWADHIQNPFRHTADDVVESRMLFQDFLSADAFISDDAWDVGNLSSRTQRIQALLDNGSLVRVN